MSLKIRPLLARDPNEHERVSTQLELFFDLVSVIAIASLTEAFHHAISAGHGLDVITNFAFLFFAIWWAWMNWTWFASAFDNQDPVFKILTIVQMGGALIFAAGVGHIFETLDFSFGVVGWTIMRISMVALWIRAGRDNPDLRRTCNNYAIGVAAAQILWILLWYFVPAGSTAFLVLGILVFLVEFSVPLTAESKGNTPFHRHHIIERYGLLNIIVLGESLLAISLGAGTFFEGHFEWALAVNFAAALVVVFLVWWLYFSERDHLKSTTPRHAFAWGYGHVFIFASGAALGAGIGATNDYLAHHSEISAYTAQWFAAVPIAIYLAALYLTRDQFQDIGIRKYAVLIGALAILLAAYFNMHLIGFAIVLTATLIWRSRDERQSHAKI